MLDAFRSVSSKNGNSDSGEMVKLGADLPTICDGSSFGFSLPSPINIIIAKIKNIIGGNR
jgi:hypothetical protein